MKITSKFTQTFWNITALLISASLLSGCLIPLSSAEAIVVPSPTLPIFPALLATATARPMDTQSMPTMMSTYFYDPGMQSTPGYMTTPGELSAGMGSPTPTVTITAVAITCPIILIEGSTSPSGKTASSSTTWSNVAKSMQTPGAGVVTREVSGDIAALCSGDNQVRLYMGWQDGLNLVDKSIISLSEAQKLLQERPAEPAIAIPWPWH